MIAPFHIDEIVVGRRVRQLCDEDCNVLEVQAIRPRGHNKLATYSNYTHAEKIARAYVSKHVDGNDTRGTRDIARKYSIKFIREKWMNCPLGGFEAAANRLANEAEIMTTLHHPHIAKIRGQAVTGIEAYYLTGRHDGFFVLLDRMQELLSERMMNWRRQRDRNSFLSAFGQRNNVRSHSLVQERIDIALQLASAVEYLHAKGIVHRDINPSNVGFNEDDKAQLFGFGSSSILPCSGLVEQDRFNGSVIENDTKYTRYVAPEILAGDPYGTACDVFAFTTLLFELLVLPDLFQFKTFNSIHVRSKDLDLPVELLELIEQGWNSNPERRPNMAQVKHVLNRVVTQFNDSSVHAQRGSCAFVVISQKKGDISLFNF
jgi:serine/threonine protein kinase